MLPCVPFPKKSVPALPREMPESEFQESTWPVATFAPKLNCIRTLKVWARVHVFAVERSGIVAPDVPSAVVHADVRALLLNVVPVGNAGVPVKLGEDSGAAPRFVRAAGAVVAPVPPLAIAAGTVLGNPVPVEVPPV